MRIPDASAGPLDENVGEQSESETELSQIGDQLVTGEDTS